MAFLQEVHDSVIYVHNTIKAIQDEAYQQMALDIGADQLGTTGEILKTSVDTLKVTKDTFDVCKDTYDTAMDISGYIGDPMKLTSYLNSRFWHENEISAALNITRDAMEMADGDVAYTGEIESMLHQVDYALSFCPRTIALKHGRVVYDGPSAELTPAFLKRLYGTECDSLFARQESDIRRNPPLTQVQVA